MRWTSSPSNPRLAIPLTLAVAEAAWASLLLNAAFDTSSRPRMQIGVLTVAIPAASAIVVGMVISRALLRRRRWLRALALGVAAVVGTALCAGVVAELALSGSFWRVASHPWAASGPQAATVAGTAWFVSALAWARGTWLRAAPPSFLHGAWSVGLGALAFVVVFAGRADAHALAFRAATGSAGWLLFLAFPCAMAALALIRQGQLQEEVTPGTASRPSSVWLSVLTVPMLTAALVALLVALAVGPVAPVVGRWLATAARGVWWVVTKVATAIWRVFPKTHAHPVRHPVKLRGAPNASPHGVLAHTQAGAVPLALEIVLGVVALILVVLAARALRPLVRLRRQAPAAGAEDETDSVFSWRHLASQLWHALAGLFARRRDPSAVSEMPSSEAGGEGPETVRLAYRGVLAAANAGGWPRSASETTREIERRLAAGPAASQAVALAKLTDQYDAVRYGERPSTEHERAVAVARADAIRRALADDTDAKEETDR